MNQVPEILERPDWDSFFLYHIYLAARKSRDTYTKIGAVFVRDNEIFSEGFNGMPRGVDDCVLERYDILDQKKFTELHQRLIDEYKITKKV